MELYLNKNEQSYGFRLGRDDKLYAVVAQRRSEAAEDERADQRTGMYS